MNKIVPNPAWSAVPPHRYHVFVCEGCRCRARGASALWAALREGLRRAGRIETPDGVLITRTQCQFPCNRGPILSVYPDRVWYGVATEDDVERIVVEHLIGGRVVADLALPLPEPE